MSEKEEKLAGLLPDAKHLIKFFTGGMATYAELQKVLLIFDIFNLDNNLGQAILDAVEDDWKNREPEGNNRWSPYLDGLMEGLGLSDRVDDSHRQRSREFIEAV